jgi:hypothetical protein
VRATVGTRKDRTASTTGFDVGFDGAGKVQYNDHVLGTLPLVVGLAAHTTGGVVLSTKFRSIIPVDAFSVKPCTLFDDQPM